MNAQIIPGVARPPNRSDYEPIVRAHMATRHVEGEELMLRASLLLVRDRAIATKFISCEPSYTLLELVEKEAGDAALNHRATIEQLRELRRLIGICVTTASGFEMLCRPRSSNVGEANAGG